MDLGLEGSIAVVTGASKGIGLAIVKAMVAEGAYVVAGARKRSDELDALVDEGHASFVEVDLAVPDGLAANGGIVDLELYHSHTVAHGGAVLVRQLALEWQECGGFLSGDGSHCNRRERHSDGA